jgi:hypothetical protein
LQYAANTRPDLSARLSCCATRRDLLDANRLLAMQNTMWVLLFQFPVLMLIMSIF